jgi:hypothetical protein
MNVNDIILHALVVRVSYSDDTIQEFRPILSNNSYEIDIPDNKLSKVLEIEIGPKIQEFIDWLAGSNIKEDVVITHNDYTITSKRRTTVICKNSVTVHLPPNPPKSYRCTVKNATDNKLVKISNVVDGESNKMIYAREAFSMIYDGEEWHIV